MGHLDPEQLPTAWEKKGKPWSTILAQDFVRRIDLVLPEESWELIRETMLSAACPGFSRVTMSLAQILQGDFFTEYIKIGDIIMLSKGRRDVDNVFTLKDGKLTLYLDKETYERAGLVGKPYGAKGDRGLKPRWVVEFDLRSPSMFKGKKGFDRLVYAAKNVVNEPVTWLFANVAQKLPTPDPLEAFHPTRCTAPPKVIQGLDVTLPPLQPPSSLVSEAGTQELSDEVSEIYEWLSLVRLQSPRVLSTDNIDPYLSRYTAPGEPEEQSSARLCTITWEGFLPPKYARQLLVDTILALPSREWFSLSVSSFSRTMLGDAAEVTFLRPPKCPGEFLLWEIKSHE
ncbi:hypothetical protein N0V93_009850 [Gnomoniopsis smithogilvyi]|uniref:Uncharacterized protein n=1 Tax=Gnomoniopsis smithogilvyi TaxID=1191159 RepID=A0A9W9CSV0_9PEZI|nr:hypothetical protein N0V93_009850 [Gnomoniopsis smithogilvyi]